MNRKKIDELQDLARATLIMLLPLERAAALPANIRKRAACREYWEPLGGVDGLCEEFRRLFAAKYATANNGMPYEFPEELGDFLSELSKLPSRTTNMVNDPALSKLLESSAVSETLRKLGESRYNQDRKTV